MNCVHRVVCPGSFDPVTNGHLDIIGRAARLYDEVVVAVLINLTKKGLFTVEERVEMLPEVTAQYGNVRIDAFTACWSTSARHGIPRSSRACARSATSSTRCRWPR